MEKNADGVGAVVRWSPRGVRGARNFGAQGFAGSATLLEGEEQSALIILSSNVTGTCGMFAGGHVLAFGGCRGVNIP